MSVAKVSQKHDLDFAISEYFLLIHHFKRNV